MKIGLLISSWLLIAAAYEVSLRSIPAAIQQALSGQIKDSDVSSDTENYTNDGDMYTSSKDDGSLISSNGSVSKPDLAGVTPLKGVCFSPYKEKECQSPKVIQEQIVMLSKITSKVRLYSIDCDQLELTLKTIHSKNLNMKVLAGIWTRSGSESLKSILSKFTKIIKKNPSYSNYIDGVVVGNEDMQNGISEDSVINNLNLARNHLKGEGIDLKVGTAEIPTSWSQKLVASCDVIYANIYSFFDRESDDKSMKTAARLIVQRAKDIDTQGKPIVISETGWPTQGETASHQSYARPTTNNQGLFLENFACIAAKENLPYYILEAFDAVWKEGPTVENNFGLMTPEGKLKFTNFSPTIRC